ncbi:MAG: hypothetical protein SPK38_10220 [Candidatus Cryptobacteroides sp.]|nr:hypothetical protein [Candidatus Cryptobacteroides sp.]
MVPEQQDHVVGVCLLERYDVPELPVGVSGRDLLSLIRVEIVPEEHYSFVLVTLDGLPPEAPSVYVRYDDPVCILHDNANAFLYILGNPCSFPPEAKEGCFLPREQPSSSPAALPGSAEKNHGVHLPSMVVVFDINRSRGFLLRAGTKVTVLEIDYRPRPAVRVLAENGF